jgi:phospholipase/carboxylesterase
MTEKLFLDDAWVKPKSGGAPKQLVVFLHGLGADGNDLISLAGEMNDALPHAQFVSPNAPYPCDMAPFGHQWFSLQSREEEDLLAGVQNVAPILNDYLDSQLATYNVPEHQLFVVGFSQGTMTALYVMPRRAQACGGVVGFSGALIGGAQLANEATAKPPICLIHGEEDAVVPFQAMAHAHAGLQQAGFTCEAHPRPDLGHGIDPQGLLHAITFIAGRA